MAGRPAKAKPAKTLEQTLWEAADKLRGNQEPSEYKHVVLGLVFLKYISDRFEERRAAIEGELLAENSQTLREMAPFPVDAIAPKAWSQMDDPVEETLSEFVMMLLK